MDCYIFGYESLSLYKILEDPVTKIIKLTGNQIYILLKEYHNTLRFDASSTFKVMNSLLLMKITVYII